MSESEKYKYQMVSIDSMNEQVNVRLPKNLHKTAKKYAEVNGFSSIQELMKETLRERIHDILTKKEIELIHKILTVSKEKSLFGTEKELFAALEGKNVRNNNN